MVAIANKRPKLNHPPDARAYGTERIPTPGNQSQSHTC